MRKLILLFSFLILSITTFAQDKDAIRGVQPPVGKPEGTFTEWQKVTVTLKSGQQATFEYRIAFSGKNAMACNYIVEVKNTSAVQLRVVIKFHYFDKLVKRDFTEAAEGKFKPGKEGEIKMTQQGCKKEKGEDKSDLENCLACDFYYDILVVE